MRATSIAEKFKTKVHKTASCWLWTSSKNTKGYGQLSHGGKHLMAHKVALELAGTQIPSGMVVDHVCRNRACVNPDHLRVVTPRVNALENSESLSAKNAAKTHCLRGHPLSGANLRPRLGKKVFRECAACATEQEQRRYQARKRGEAQCPQR